MAGQPAELDALELELRQLPGVILVAFDERPGAAVVEISALPGSDLDAVRAEGTRLAVNHLPGPVLVEVAPVVVDEAGVELPRATSRLRVQLLAVVPRGTGGTVEIHLAHRSRRTTVTAPRGDRAGAAASVVDALHRLGLPVPFAVESAHELSADLGSGTLVVLRDPATGQSRRGLAPGRSAEEAAARAVLNALNRYLQGGVGLDISPA